MSKPLIVVESPTKIRTIKKYTGTKYNVVATVGHIMDLPPKEMGIDISNNFEPEYVPINGKQKVITSLKKAATGSTEIFLAPDPDREGEAIAFHTAQVLKKKGRNFHRVLFHELTKKAINEALASPELMDAKKYEAQQARRMLDRLVGYQISPLLWRKVKGGLSAGRVQSVTVRIICERERAIQAFIPVEYWSITAFLESDSPPVFTAKLAKKNKKKIVIPDEKSSTDILKELSGCDFVVDKVVKKTTKRNPAPPFITSKLQQESIRKLRFTAKKTMMVAQQLYEGVGIGSGEPEGLITYMRTDSVRISDEAAFQAIDFIKKKFGDKFLPEKRRFFKNKKKTQDAHEAIRPTSVLNTPEKLQPFLSRDQFVLYRLIWQRFLASQMQHALINMNSISIKAGVYIFTTSGSSIKFPGFMTLYMSFDEQSERESEKKKDALPELTEGMVLKLNKLEPKQHFTQPPPRFSEASLVKELEENGIGRPSTYAAILSIIRGKGYVDLVKRYFRPSELGFIVNDLLVHSFPDVFGVNFTARMEDNLDRIENAEEDCSKLLSRFYKPFKIELDAAKEGMLSMRGVGMPTGLKCPLCSKQLHIKVGKNGNYLACIGYPDCSFTANYTRDEKGKIEIIENPGDEVTDKICEKCGKNMVIKHGKFGAFLSCSGYPACKNTRSLNSESSGADTGIACPEKNCAGKIVEKKSRRGKLFYGCNRYPDCTFALWDKPVAAKCPTCGAKFLVEKSTKKDGEYLACNTKGCGYRQKKE